MKKNFQKLMTQQQKLFPSKITKTPNMSVTLLLEHHYKQFLLFLILEVETYGLLLHYVNLKPAKCIKINLTTDIIAEISKELA